MKIYKASYEIVYIDHEDAEGGDVPEEFIAMETMKENLEQELTDFVPDEKNSFFKVEEIQCAADLSPELREEIEFEFDDVALSIEQCFGFKEALKINPDLDIEEYAQFINLKGKYGNIS